MASLEEAMERYENAKQELERNAKIAQHTEVPGLAGVRAVYDASVLDLMVVGLDSYLAAATKDRESATKDRESAELDRKDQKKARWAMIALTVAIVFVGTLGYFKPPAPIVVPAPIVAASPAPVVNVPAVPVTLNPTINVTVPWRPLK